MQWRKEPNDWINQPLRFALSYQERDVYHSLRCMAGNYGNTDRQGYVERSAGTPYRNNELSVMIGEPVEIIESTIAKAREYGELEYADGECLHFTGWIGIDERKKKRGQMSAKEQEYFDRANLERLAMQYKDSDTMTEIVERRIQQMFNDGQINVNGGGENGK